MKQMRLRYTGVCRLCGASLPAGTEAIYESETKTVRCLGCATRVTETMSPESGVAGSSAGREYDRRKAKDEEKLREKWGRLGGLAVALSDERPHTKAWDRGAIDAKRYKGRPELKIEGGILRPRLEKLLVGRRDCTKLVDGVLKQVDVVRDLVGDVPVTGVLCFVEADWPLIGGAFSTRGIHVLWPKRLAKVLTEQTSGDVDVPRIRETVASRFRSA